MQSSGMRFLYFFLKSDPAFNVHWREDSHKFGLCICFYPCNEQNTLQKTYVISSAKKIIHDWIKSYVQDYMCRGDEWPSLWLARRDRSDWPEGLLINSLPALPFSRVFLSVRPSSPTQGVGSTMNPQKFQKSACPHQSCSFRLHQALDQHTAVRQIPPHENRLPELVLRDNVEIVRKHACQASFEDKSCYC